MSESLFDFQDKILQWIKNESFVTWQQIKDNCNDFVYFLPKEEKSKDWENPEYRIFLPLLRNGCVEVARNTERPTHEKNGFCFVWNRRRDDVPTAAADFDSLGVLRSFPRIRDMIKFFPPADVSKDSLEESEDGLYTTGRYLKQYFIYDVQGRLHEIPNFNSLNYDALFVARTYARIRNKKMPDIFSYDEQKQELCIKDYEIYRNFADDFPILVMRALICFCPSQLKDKDFYDRVSENLVYKSISPDAYKELKRIFT